MAVGLAVVEQNSVMVAVAEERIVAVAVVAEQSEVRFLEPVEQFEGQLA